MGVQAYAHIKLQSPLKAAMTRYLPKTNTEALPCIGEAKLQRYGKAFLEMIEMQVK